MIAKTFSVIFSNSQPIIIQVEVTQVSGIPLIQVVGLPSRIVNESITKIVAAFKNCAIKIKQRKTIINLAPMDVPKVSSHLELAIAASLLRINGLCSWQMSNCVFLGELSLDGSVRSIKNCRSIVLSLLNKGYKRIYIAADDFSSLGLVRYVNLHPIRHVSELLRQEPKISDRLSESVSKSQTPSVGVRNVRQMTFGDIAGEERSKRLFTIAAVGGFSLLVFGQDEILKYVLAKIAISILPTLEQEYVSLDDQGSDRQFLAREKNSYSGRPVVKIGPETTCSEIFGRKSGYGSVPIASLAHHGLLYLENGSEFAKKTIDRIWSHSCPSRFSNNDQARVFEANYQIIVSAKICPCGKSHQTSEVCSCSKNQRMIHQRKLQTLFEERIEMFGELTAHSPFLEAAGKLAGPSCSQGQAQTGSYLDRENIARAYLRRRSLWSAISNTEGLFSSSQLIREFKVTHEAEKLLRNAAVKLALNTKQSTRVLAISRTIADLDCQTNVHYQQVAEALQYVQSPISD
ncbi:MAG: magnesium chelatase domain-containing protein [Patescibacteria group bacterium]